MLTTSSWGWPRVLFLALLASSLALLATACGEDSSRPRPPDHDTVTEDTHTPGSPDVRDDGGAGDPDQPSPPLACPPDNPPCDGSWPLQRVVISEIQAAPCALSNEQGQWLEIINVGDQTLDFACWTLSGNDPAADNHRIEPLSGSLIAGPGEILVLARSDQWDTLTGNTSDYVYGDDIRMRRTSPGRLALLDHCGRLVTEINYGGDGWPPRDCRTLQLSAERSDPADNDAPDAWCVSPGDGDAGSPGAMNIVCETAPPDPCTPNPCTPAPDDACSDDGLVVVRFTAPGTCTALSADSFDCDYAAVAITDCGVRGGRCEAGACVDEARLPEVGEVIFTEIMYDPHHDLDDTAAEWFEITNISAESLYLGGCVLDNSRQNAPLNLAPLTLPAGGITFFARSADPLLNGGLEPEQVFRFQLLNTTDTLTLHCDGVLIDRVEYGTAFSFPAAQARALSLDPGTYDHELNDIGANWCRAADVYYEDAQFDPERQNDPARNNFGTPGAPNPPCFATVDWCRLDRPLDIELLAGESFELFGRVYEPGVTDTEATMDIATAIEGQAGFGPVAVRPDRDAHGAWAWSPAVIVPDYAPLQDAPRDDAEFRATLTAPAVGEYRFAYRFRLKGQPSSWLYCDRDTGVPGEDGAENGYQQDNAGTLMSLPSPCTPNPCVLDEPIVDCCADGLHVLTLGTVGECTIVEEDEGLSWTCDYPVESRIDCSVRGGRCEEAVCIEEADHPVVGGVIFTEIMYDPHFDLLDATAEWFEIMNVSDVPVYLGGCAIKDSGTGALTVNPLVLAPRALALFARSADPNVNGGITPFQTVSFPLHNTADSLTLTCDDIRIDHVAYSVALGFPPAQARSLSLDPSAFDHEANDLAENWCLSDVVYYHDGGGDPARHNFGTPGAVNPRCYPVAAWCRLERPLDDIIFAGETFEIAARVREPGITDLTTGTDPSDALRAEAGIGPVGNDPTATPEVWSWQTAFPNLEWDGALAGEPDNDEYHVLAEAPSEGAYQLAFRFSIDRGRTWLYCDRDTGFPGEDGSENGYQVANAGSLVTVASPCSPNPCTAVPLATCAEEGEWRITFVSPGQCTVLTDGYDCDYPELERVDCAATGRLCIDGSCVDDPTDTATLIFSEYVEGSSNNKAVEIYNPRRTVVPLDGCVVRVYNNGATVPTSTIPLSADTLLAPGGAFVLCNTQFNGSNTAPYCDQLSGSLNHNGNDAIELNCSGLLLDVIGLIGEDPGEAWGTGDTTTKDHTLLRDCSINRGYTDTFGPFDPAAAGWIGMPLDSFDDLGQHCVDE